MSEARIHPPSEQRLAEARRRGHVPRAPLVGLFAAFTALIAWLLFAGPELTHALATLLRLPLERTARGEALSFAELAPPLKALALAVASGLGFAFVALALGTLVAQGPAFGFASGSRLRLPPLRPGRMAQLLFVLGLPLVLAGQLARVLRVDAHSLVPLLRDLALHTAAWLALCGLLQASLARARHVRSLWLTRTEHKDEQREAYGSPEMRRARERVRRDLGARS